MTTGLDPPDREEDAMETASVLTLCLAEAIGLYLAAIGVGALIDPDRWRRLGVEMERSAGLPLAMGVLTFAIGAAMFGAHHHLGDPLAAIITVMGAIGALEGLLLIAVPRALILAGRPFFEHPRPWAIVAVAGGILLFLVGLTGHAPMLP
jgi:hypothetical protein